MPFYTENRYMYNIWSHRWFWSRLQSCLNFNKFLDDLATDHLVGTHVYWPSTVIVTCSLITNWYFSKPYGQDIPFVLCLLILAVRKWTTAASQQGPCCWHTASWSTQNLTVNICWENVEDSCIMTNGNNAMTRIRTLKPSASLMLFLLVCTSETMGESERLWPYSPIVHTHMMYFIGKKNKINICF